MGHRVRRPSPLGRRPLIRTGATKGNLTRWLRRQYGKRPFRLDGTISTDFLEELMKNKTLPSRRRWQIKRMIPLLKVSRPGK